MWYWIVWIPYHCYLPFYVNIVQISIMMMSDTFVLGTRRNSLSETFFRAQNICLARLQFHVETVAHRSNYTYYSVLSINNMSI